MNFHRFVFCIDFFFVPTLLTSSQFPFTSLFITLSLHLSYQISLHLNYHIHLHLNHHISLRLIYHPLPSLLNHSISSLQYIICNIGSNLSSFSFTDLPPRMRHAELLGVTAPTTSPCRASRVKDGSWQHTLPTYLPTYLPTTYGFVLAPRTTRRWLAGWCGGVVWCGVV